MTAEPGTQLDRVRVAAYAVVHDGDGRLLLCHIAPSVLGGDLWTLPGGGLQFGESPADGVLRELTEETGYDGAVETLVDVTDRLFQHVDGADRMHAIRILYRVRLTGGERRDEVDGSSDRCAWFTPAEARAQNLTELARHALALGASRSDGG